MVYIHLRSMPTFFAMLIKNPCVRLSSYVKITVVESHSQLITKSSSCAHPLMASIRLEQVQESIFDLCYGLVSKLAYQLRSCMLYVTKNVC